jgi:organic radical activating enzyme
MTSRSVRIDAASVCQLRCPGCTTGTGQLPSTVGSGLLSVEDLVAFLDRHPGVRHVELSNWGEVLLNPQLPTILRELHERRVQVTLNNGINFNTVSEEAMEALVKYRVRSMVFSIDGATQEAYETYRVRGNLERVLANIKTLNALKATHRTSFPVLTWKMILFGHNQHEIEAARAKALQLGMSFRTEINTSGSAWELADEDAARKASGLDVVSQEQHVEVRGTTFSKRFCHQLWNAPQINWNGKILGCCMNTWSDFGSEAFSDQGLQSERLIYARRMLMGKGAEREDIPCTTCGEYTRMRDEGAWVRPNDVLIDRFKRRMSRAVTTTLGARWLQPLGARVLTWASAVGR